MFIIISQKDLDSFYSIFLVKVRNVPKKESGINFKYVILYFYLIMMKKII